MKDLCVPIPNFGQQEFAEIEIKLGDKQSRLYYRVVSFPWDELADHVAYNDNISLSLVRIERLRKSIENYDKGWELIQIFNPAENAKNIQVLYRKSK